VRLRDSVPLPDGSLALVLDLVDGGTLAQLVAARGHLRPGEVVTVLAPLAAALAELHAAGIQHGDIAPGNVLFDASGRPMLGDLGTVRITGERREEQFGTPGYVDPVVVAGGAAGPASDVYGLGALAWFALTGSAPPGAVLRPPLDDVVPGLPAALVAAVETALDPDPARRPQPAALARQVYDAAPAAPVWLVGSTPADGGLTRRIRELAVSDAAVAPPRHRRHAGRWRRRVRDTSGSSPAAVPTGRRRSRSRAALLGAGLVAVALLVLAAVQLLEVGSPPDRLASDDLTAVASDSNHVVPPGRTLSTLPGVVATVVARGPAPMDADAAAKGPLSDAEVTSVVQQLAAGRAAAFITADVTVLDRVTVAGSPADRVARAAVDALRQQGLVYRGLELRTRSAHVRSTDGEAVVVDVVTDVSAYDVVDGQGNVRRRQAARPRTTSSLVLVATSGGWRVKDTLA
jgi:eukaryotic-like serine/threonine-protein kinase